MKYSLLLSAIFILLVASSCHQGKDKGVLLKKSEEPISVLSLKYARGFSIHYFDGFKIISVRDGKDTTKLLAEYILYPKSSSAPLGYDKAVKIGTPVDKVVCISTTHIAELVKLNLVDRIAGITGASLIYNQEVHQRIEQGAIANLGNDEMDFERLVEIAPSFVLSSGSYDGGDKLNIKLRSLNIPSVLNLDYMEQDPLARAEWLKFMAAFFDREKEADSLFSITEEKYLSLKNQMKQVVQRPTVFCNIPFKEIWYMPCGENYMAFD
ncbi:MAG: ABC transporter substrate-binding protein [Bacteroidetes bacterium]|nr:ABC transporter substrate-binding protein [Bacteroidota bacterium]